jgi:hypothetical protein
MVYNSSQQELEELRVAALEACQGSRRRGAGRVLGNSGKPVTLETSSFMKFVK